MLKVFATQVIISKGYDDKPAISITKNNEASAARFRIGKKVYDPKADGNSRWLNYSVKCFGQIVDRIEKMQLKEGCFVNIIGRLDEDHWEDQNTHEKKSAPVIILEDIEYASSSGKKEGNSQNSTTSNQAPAQNVPAPQDSNAGGFTGFEPFGGGSFFDEN